MVPSTQNAYIKQNSLKQLLREIMVPSTQNAYINQNRLKQLRIK